MFKAFKLERSNLYLGHIQERLASAKQIIITWDTMVQGLWQETFSELFHPTRKTQPGQVDNSISLDLGLAIAKTVNKQTNWGGTKSGKLE